jgi:GNAT superfamily N-acetyltransferase
MEFRVAEKGNGKTLLPGEGKEKQLTGSLMLSCGMASAPELKYGCRQEPELVIKGYEKGKLVGIAGINRRYLIFNALFVAVADGRQGKGYGTLLVKEVLKRKKGPLFLTVWHKNRAARKIYDKEGFKKICRWRKVLGMGTDLMVHL